MKEQISKQITEVLNEYAQFSEHGKHKPKVLQNVDVLDLEKAITRHITKLLINNYTHISTRVC